MTGERPSGEPDGRSCFIGSTRFHDETHVTVNAALIHLDAKEREGKLFKAIDADEILAMMKPRRAPVTAPEGPPRFDPGDEIDPSDVPEVEAPDGDAPF